MLFLFAENFSKRDSGKGKEIRDLRRKEIYLSWCNLCQLRPQVIKLQIFTLGGVSCLMI